MDVAKTGETLTALWGEVHANMMAEGAAPEPRDWYIRLCAETLGKIEALKPHALHVAHEERKP